MTKCNYTQERFQDALNKFKKAISDNNATLLEKINNPDEQDRKKAIAAAVDLAYNDAKRTMHGITEEETEKEKAKQAIANKIFDYLFPKLKTQLPDGKEKFDKYHNGMCDAWCEPFKNHSLKKYGKAQKIVNMTFKYLYCYADDILKERFKYCHMPLDSFTLEWFKRIICNSKDKILKTKVGSWSSMSKSNESNITQGKSADEKYAYSFYVDKIQEYIKNNGIDLSPLQLEFIIWPETQLNLATENFLFALHDNYDDEEDAKTRKEYNKEIRSLDLEEKIKEVKKIIDNLYL